MAEEPQRDGHGERQVTSATEFLDIVPLPPDAHLTESIRVYLRAVVTGDGDDDPQALPALALAPLLIALGRLEIDLADARTRIAELERRLGRRG
ncbi:hypothetical protein ACFVAV_15810 [Nocardia sp. NPDC057663]|uniref:hypothetical protein n=1 Tax=Nocardia sp. NPDC057663 TaxID=3346201 RepID=UPI0036718FC2